MGKRGPKNIRLPYFEKHVMEPSVGCRLWPFSLRGKYGAIRVDGKMTSAHIMACERWYGPRPEGMQAAHSCGNTSCWAGEHLRWATPAGNEADKLVHGTAARGARHGMAKLTETQVHEIRDQRAAGFTLQSIGDKYDITPQAVWRIANRKIWKHI